MSRLGLAEIIIILLIVGLPVIVILAVLFLKRNKKNKM